jgi:flagellar basal-body rod protein FlgC
MSTLMSALKVSASGLAAQRARVNATASNIANVHTTRGPDGGPYRRQDPVFETVFQGRGIAGVRVAQIQQDQAPPRQVYDPGHPDANPEGYVGMPNVNLVEEIVNMISAQRSYDANASSIEATRKMARSALGILSS